MPKKVSLLLCVCFSFLLFTPASFSQVEEEVRVSLIEIWVKVTDKQGRIIDDLTAEDFQVFIDNQQMDTRCFDKTFDDYFADFTKEEPLEPQSTSEDGMSRKFIFFFDLLNTSARNLDYLKRQMVDFLQNSFRDSDQGMIFALLPSVHLGVVRNMTSDKYALIDTINKMRGNPTMELRARNNERELLDVLYAFNQVGSAGLAEGGPTARAGENIRAARGLARTLAAQEQNLSKLTLNSFLSIASYLSANDLPGRLVMIYVSGGFPLRPGQNYFEIVEKAIENASVVGTEDLAFRDYPQEDFQNEVRKTIGLLNRLNVTIYSVDAKGLISNDRSAERDQRQMALGYNNINYLRERQDSLVMIARETGGTAFTNTQNFQRGLAEITTDMNQQYWLCSNLPPDKKRGKYHKIEVKVNRPDVNVRHRKGYVD